MGGLTAHHFASHDALGVLHRNAPLGALHEDDERNHRDHHCNQNYHRNRGQRAPGLVARLVVDILDAARQPDHNAGKDQQRHAVSDAALGDLLAQPHDEGRAGGQRDDAQRNETRREGWSPCALPELVSDQRNGEGLNDAQQNRDVARPLRDLAPAQFAFLL